MASTITVRDLVHGGGVQKVTVNQAGVQGPTGPKGNAGTSTAPSFTKANLPTDATAGDIARVTDNIRGLWYYTGTAWKSITGQAHASDWGAVGDDSADDTTELQAWLNDLKTYNAVGVLGGGTSGLGLFRISSTLTFDQQMGWAILGDSSASATGTGGTTGARSGLKWVGGAGGTMLRLQGVRNGTLDSISLDGNNVAGVCLDYDAVSGGVVTTNNTINRLVVTRATSRGVQIGKSNFQTDQTDWHQLEARDCGGGPGIGVSIEDANAVWHRFFGGVITGNVIGITSRYTGTGGHFMLYGTDFLIQSDHDIGVYPGRTHAFFGVQSEASNRFLVTGNSSGGRPVTLHGCFVNTITASDQIGIDFNSPSPLVMNGCGFRSGQVGLPFKIKGSIQGTRSTFIANGCFFDGNPWGGINNNARVTVITEGNTYETTPTSTTVPEIRGLLPRLTPSTPNPLTTDPATTTDAVWAGLMWVRIPSGTSLVAGANLFYLKSNNCNGVCAIEIPSINNLTGNAASVVLGISGRDNNAGTAKTAEINVRCSGAVTTNAHINFAVQFRPEPVTY